jgi:lysophospholipase L1-like esterase
MQKKWILLLLITNVASVAAFCLLVHKFGGFRYTWYRYKTNDAGLQAMRREHFEYLPKAQKQAHMARIVMLGDSQVQNAEWQEMLGSDSLQVLNRGISGDHIEGVRQRIGEALSQQPQMVFVWVGINDLFYGRSVQEVEQMYTSLVHELRTQAPIENTTVVLCTLAPVQGGVKYLPMDSQPVHAFNQRLAALAKAENYLLLDTAALLSDKDGNLKAEFTLDGVHLTHTAYTLIKQQMEPLILAHTRYGI